MTNLRKAAEQALEALEWSNEYLEIICAKLFPKSKKTQPGSMVWHLNKAITTLRAALAEPEQEPVAHSIVAGALFDFMGWLTTRKKQIVLSSTDDASPAVEVITEFAKMRGLSLDNANVQNWNTAPPQRKPLTEEQRLDIVATALRGHASTRDAIQWAIEYVERHHSIKE